MRILVVDDDPSLQQLLVTVLGELGEVVVAADAPSADMLVRQAQPDLVVLDVMLPGTTGVQLLTRWRRDPMLRDLPVVMLSALDDRLERQAGYDAGADGYITKPFDVQLLALVAQQVIDDESGVREVVGRA